MQIQFFWSILFTLNQDQDSANVYYFWPINICKNEHFRLCLDYTLDTSSTPMKLYMKSVSKSGNQCQWKCKVFFFFRPLPQETLQSVVPVSFQLCSLCLRGGTWFSGVCGGFLCPSMCPSWDGLLPYWSYPASPVTVLPTENRVPMYKWPTDFKQMTFRMFPRCVQSKC